MGESSCERKREGSSKDREGEADSSGRGSKISWSVRDKGLRMQQLLEIVGDGATGNEVYGGKKGSRSS